MTTIIVAGSKVIELTTQRNVGKISRDVRSMSDIEWNVPNFFDLPEKVGHRVESPVFPFLGEEWRLRIYPNGETTYNSSGCIGLYLMRNCSNNHACHLTYRLGIKTKEGTECKVFNLEKNFERIAGWGIAKLIERSTLMSERRTFAPGGAVTFFCKIHAKVNEGKAVATQTIQTTGFDALIQDFKQLLTGEDADIVLRVKDKEFRAHKAVLRARSPVFRSMFTHSMKEGNSGVVDVTDCDPTAFKEFLHFIYCGSIEELSLANVFDLYFVADKYDVLELRAICAEFIIDNITMDTFFDSIIVAQRHNEPTVLKHATNFFILNGIAIMESAQWVPFQKQNLEIANELVLKMLKSKRVSSRCEALKCLRMK